MTPPSLQQSSVSVPSPGSASSTTSMTGSGLPPQSPPLRQNQSPARSLPSPVTPPMPLQVSSLYPVTVCHCVGPKMIFNLCYPSCKSCSLHRPTSYCCCVFDALIQKPQPVDVCSNSLTSGGIVMIWCCGVYCGETKANLDITQCG